MMFQGTVCLGKEAMVIKQTVTDCTTVQTLDLGLYNLYSGMYSSLDESFHCMHFKLMVL